MTETLETAPVASAVIAPSSVDVDKLDTAKPLAEIFQSYRTTLEKWEAKAKSLVVTDISMKTEMQQARLARLELRAARIAMDKTRVGLVENLKARTSKIDGTARVIREKIESLEAILLESEEFAERYAAKIKDELNDKRCAEVLPFLESTLHMPADLSDLSETDYAKYLADVKMLRQAKIDAAAKAESDRLAKEAADRAERERIASENAKLKEIAAEMELQAAIQRKQHEAEVAEQKRLAEIEHKRVAAERAKEKAAADAEWRRIEDERQAERYKAEADKLLALARAKKEREAIQAKAGEEARKARAEQGRLNAELDAKRKAEAAERVEKEREAKRAAAAPDKAKLKSYADSIRGFVTPALSDYALRDKLIVKRNEFAAWVESQIDTDLL